MKIQRNWQSTFSPHCIKEGPVILEAQKLVGGGHVVSDGFFTIVEKSIWGPDLAGKEIVKRKALHRTFKPKPFIFPALSEKDIDGIFLA